MADDQRYGEGCECPELRAENERLQHAVAREAICAACGEGVVDRDATDVAERMAEHIMQCEKHPVAAVLAENERLRRWVSDLHSGMYINCVYCGHRYGPKDEVPAAMADVLKEHIEQCPEHPCSKLKAENERLRKAIALYGLDYKVLVERCLEAKAIMDKLGSIAQSRVTNLGMAVSAIMQQADRLPPGEIPIYHRLTTEQALAISIACIDAKADTEIEVGRMVREAAEAAKGETG